MNLQLVKERQCIIPRQKYLLVLGNSLWSFVYMSLSVIV